MVTIDEPRPQNGDNRRPFGRNLPFPRMFPAFGGRFPMLEGGYTVITVDVGDPSPVRSFRRKRGIKKFTDRII